MTRFFKPYEGKRPFFFISYAHRQSEEVIGTIRILHEKGWRLWYDEGIPAGSDWPANIAAHMRDCERVIFFLSARALESHNCYSEMKTAAALGKPILIVRLEEEEIPENWKEILGAKTEIPVLPDAGERAEAILRSGFLLRRFHRKWTENVSLKALGLCASLLFFAAALGVFGAIQTGRWDPFPPAETSVWTPPETQEAETESYEPPEVVDIGGAARYFALSFPDSEQERAVRGLLSQPEGEIYRWQLSEITDLYYCGNLQAKSLSEVSVDAGGTFRRNGAPVAEGEIADLSLFPYMVRLERLALLYQPLTDPGPLSGLVRLSELWLSGSDVSDLSELTDLPSLTTLHLEYTAVRDLHPLTELPNLKTVTVSRDMLPLTWEEDAGFTVELIREP